MGLSAQREKYLNVDMDRPQSFHLENHEVFIYTSKGSKKKRQKNEDSCGVIFQGKDHLVLIVSDGLGGHKMGDVASKIVINTIVGRSLQRKRYLQSFEIIKRIEKSHEKIKTLKSGAGATVVVGVISGGKVRLMCVGDSVGFHFGKNGELKYKSFEHSVVGFATESGLIDNETAMKREDSNIILNSLGFDDSRLESSFDMPMSKGEVVFLCSDGVTDLISINDLSAFFVAPNLVDSCQGLIEKLSSLRSKKSFYDDLSFILVKKINH